MKSVQVNKNAFLHARKCEAMGWFERRPKKVPPSETELFAMEEGQNIGQLARSLFPGGIDLNDTPHHSSIDSTQAVLSNSSTKTLYEAKFVADGLVARADMLVRGEKGWKICEVKSALEGTSRYSDYIDDVSYTSLVASMAGLDIESISLVLLSRDFRIGMPTEALFVELDVTSEAKSVVEEMRFDAHGVRDVLLDDSPPEVDLCRYCKDCEYFSTSCVGKDLSHPIFELPRFPTKDIATYAANGMRSILDLPLDFNGNEVYKRVLQSVHRDVATLEDGLDGALSSVKWPAFYLDFETVRTAFPLMPDVAPYEQVLTQYSLHICSGPGEVSMHAEFLASHDSDCRRELAESLINALDSDGTIIVYYVPFERSRIRELSRMFPDLAESLTSIEARLFDLLPVVRDHYYHPDFAGSYSIKKVLPAMVPNLSYENMEISDGLLASVRFAKMMMGAFDLQEIEQQRRFLLEYCKLDTLAMVELHKRLHELGEA